MTSAQKTSISAYAEDLELCAWPPNNKAVSEGATLSPAGPLKRTVRKVVTNSVLQSVQTLGTRCISPLTKRRLARLETAGADITVQFGCGFRPIPGWANLDLVWTGADFYWDLRRPVPLRDGSVTAVYHEHFLEHLPFQAALSSLREAHRLLRPGGVVRIGVPDFSRYCQGYVNDDGFLAVLKPERPTPCLAINELLYWHGHRSMWDEETLLGLLAEIGFVDVERRDFGESTLNPCPDSEIHEFETLYVEARKP